MHENTFLTTPDVKTYLLKGHDSCGLEVFEIASKHVFNHARQSKISFLKKVSGSLEVCAKASKHVFNHSKRSKISFFEKKFLVVWKYAQVHQNTFLTTPDVQKYLF
jgi:hypothetical protein